MKLFVFAFGILSGHAPRTLYGPVGGGIYVTFDTSKLFIYTVSKKIHNVAIFAPIRSNLTNSFTKSILWLSPQQLVCQNPLTTWACAVWLLLLLFFDCPCLLLFRLCPLSCSMSFQQPPATQIYNQYDQYLSINIHWKKQDIIVKATCFR